MTDHAVHAENVLKEKKEGTKKASEVFVMNDDDEEENYANAFTDMYFFKPVMQEMVLRLVF